MKIELINKGWSKFADSEISVFFIGYLEFNLSLFLTASELAVFFSELSIYDVGLSSFMLEKFLPYANGNFAFILKDKSQYIVACDYTRNYPLYVINDASNAIVADHIGELTFKKEHDELAQEEFLIAGFVTGNRTVYKNVKGVQAGEMAVIDNGNISFQRYFVLKSDPFRKKFPIDLNRIYDEMDNLLINTFKRMIKSCPNVNNWIVPLSGGFDSRLTINYLYRLGCKNVVCFSYGNSVSIEAIYSKQAAEALGFTWYFVEYTANEWKGLHGNGLLDKYIKYAFNGCCLPHFQDLLALKILKDKGVINENDVIVPGHSAFTEAANVKIKDISTHDEALRYVFNKYYTLFPSLESYPRFASNLTDLFHEGEQSNYSFPEFFNWQERQAKFINNSVRAYEFFGLDWRLPFWEKDMIDFWHELNFDDRVERALLFAAGKEKLFHEDLKQVPLINKFKKPKVIKRKSLIIIPKILKSLIVRIVKRKAFIAEGTNYIFALKARSVWGVLHPMSLYPNGIKKHILSILIRKPYQVDVNTLTAIYTLKNEVYVGKTHNIHE